MEINNKLKKLQYILEDIGSAVIAFSGGVDSTFLAKTAVDTLKNRVLAVTCVSAFLSESEKKEARRLAKKIKISHQFVKQRLVPELLNNPKDRCYYCKKEVFSGLIGIARCKGFSAVIDGSNADDLMDYRPGRKALKELGIRSPLQEVGLTKKDIRLLSKDMGLDTWNKPAMACLGSRFAYGERITRKKLLMVEKAEEFLRALRITQFRVRNHSNLCRIEAGNEDVSIILKDRIRIIKKMKSLGFTYVTIDLEGYRIGSMNEIWGWKRKR
ncbi:MAG: ATP-dependent sacrificial sulfur transferase LarE [Candidatus Omnitrophota bacterium]